MSVQDLRCAYSTVKNTSGGRKKFGFLPPHGRELAANEEFTVFGSILESVIRFERSEGRRSIIALENAVQRGDILILNTPAPIFQDSENGAHIRMLRFSGDQLVMDSPCWTSAVADTPLG